MEVSRSWLSSPATVLRIALSVFVFAWILGPDALRSAVPILLVFLIALGLELNFLVSAFRSTGSAPPDRRPQEIDRERYGYDWERDDLDVSPEEPDELAEVEPTYRRSLAPVRRFLVGLGVIAALGLTIWFVESRTGWDSLDGRTRAEAVERFSGEASRIADKPVTIYCDESRDFVGAVQHADGVAEVGGERAYLTPEICLDLYRLAFEDDVRGSRTGRAIAVLAHEAWHLRGLATEGATECYALQSGVAVGQRLGLSEGRARQLMRQQLTENALRSRGSFEYLVPPECRDGGRLDLDPGRTAFP
jgi:hypothetical protein